MTCRSLPPQLTIDGLIRLLHHIESDFASNGSEGDYYRSPILKTEDKENIIQCVNEMLALCYMLRCLLHWLQFCFYFSDIDFVCVYIYVVT